MRWTAKIPTPPPTRDSTATIVRILAFSDRLSIHLASGFVRGADAVAAAAAGIGW
jgi:hypothetical protein